MERLLSFLSSSTHIIKSGKPDITQIFKVLVFFKMAIIKCYKDPVC